MLTGPKEEGYNMDTKLIIKIYQKDAYNWENDIVHFVYFTFDNVNEENKGILTNLEMKFMNSFIFKGKGLFFLFQYLDYQNNGFVTGILNNEIRKIKEILDENYNGEYEIVNTIPLNERRV